MATAAAVAALLAVPGGAPGPAASAHEDRQPGALRPCERPEHATPEPVDVELVTVSESSFAVTWLTCAAGAPAATDTTVAYGTDPNPLTWRRVTVEDATAFHHAEIGGLRPGTTYHYQVYSGGLPGRADRYHPGAFTTLDPPPGKPVLTFAVLADTHLGEETSGQAATDPLSGRPFPPSYHGHGYATEMAEAAVAEINDHRVDLVVLPGDNTSKGQLGQLQELHGMLDGLGSRYLIARGSHDRPNQGTAAADCAPDGDCFRAVFFPDRPATEVPQPIAYSRKVKGRYRFVALDSSDLGTGSGRLDPGQLTWLEGELDEARRRREQAFVFFHHPVTEWSTTLAVPPLVFGVPQADAERFLSLVGRYRDTVRAVFTAHTHRNWLTYSPRTGRLPFVEVGPSKEYPGGYTVVKLYKTGFTRTFYRTGGRADCEFCREWQATTRGEYFGRYPDYTTGSLRDRNFAHDWTRPDDPGVPSLPFNVWPPAAPLDG